MNARSGLVLALAFATVAACAKHEGATSGAPSPSGSGLGPEPPPSAVGAESGAQRLTYAQYANAIHALFGDDVVVAPAASLEPDLRQAGLVAIGASFATISPRGVEQYEKAAYDVAAQVLASDARKARVLPCVPSGPTDDACARAFATTFGRRAWRRPLSADEVAAIAGVTTKAAASLGTFEQGLAYGLAALLQSPSFLFRPAIGEPDPKTPATRYTAYEMASRLAFFLWNAPPDDALLDAAEAGALVTDEGLAREATRLLASPRAHDGLRSFVSDWLGLGELDNLSKDATLFTYYTPDLGKTAREETLRVFERQVFDLDADIRDVLTTTHTFANPKLASMYEVPAPVPGDFGEVDLPASGGRRGLLGHISVLSLYAHPTQSSSTLRGKFIRTVLLCGVIPPPPVNVNTSLPEVDPNAPTLRDRMKQHMQNPTCNGCHSQMDPIGLGLETFDAVGRFRTKDHGAPIDPSGTLDDTPFANAWELAQVVHDHPDLPGCIAKSLYRYATQFQDGDADKGTLARLTWEFGASGHRLKALILATVLSPAFRQKGAPAAAAP